MMLKKEIYVGTSIEEFNQVRQLLDDNDMKYTYKVVDQTSSEATIISPGMTRRSAGTYGMDMSQLKQYYIFTDKNNYDKANFILSNDNKK